METGELEQIREKAHYIAITGVVINEHGKYLICKRSPREKLFPNKWCFPGGKLQQQDFINSQKDTKDYWLDIFEKTLIREIKEEVGITVKPLTYIASLAMIRPNGFSTIIINMVVEKIGGEIRLNEQELTEHAWVNLQEAKNYDLIDNIYEQMEKVEEKYKKAWVV